METGQKALERLVSELTDLGMNTMANSLEGLYYSKDFLELDHLSLLQKIVGAEYNAKTAKKLANRMKRARLANSPCEIHSCVDSRDREYLPKGITSTLSELSFIRNGMNVCILGPSDSGKSYLAKALGIIACRQYRVSYFHCASFAEEMVALKNRDFRKFQKKMNYNARVELLILDDFLLHTITDEREIKVLFELLEKRSELRKSTIICSQREPKSWASMMLNDEVSSNAILKRATKHYVIVINPKNND